MRANGRRGCHKAWLVWVYGMQINRHQICMLKCHTLDGHNCHTSMVSVVRKGVGKTWVQFSSVAQSCPTLCDPMNRSTPGLPVHHQLPEFTQTHVHRVSGHPAISSSVVPFSSCPQSLPASGTFPMSQLFTWGGQILEFQPQHQSFQWTPRIDLL